MKILRIVIGGIVLGSFIAGLSFTLQNSSNESNNEDFLGYVYVGDIDPIPDLDFVIVTKKLPDQSHLLYEALEYYVRIYRKSNPKHFDTIEKIRSEINKRWLKGDNKVKVHVFGRYSDHPDPPTVLRQPVRLYVLDKLSFQLPHKSFCGGRRGWLEPLSSPPRFL